MPGETTTRTVPADETTGVQPVPAGGYQPIPAPLFTRDLLAKIFFSAVPVIFTAGALFVSVTSMTARQDEQERALRSERERTSRLETDLRILQSTMQTLSTQQDKLVGKVESIDDKMNEQRATLSAIGERLGASPRARSRSEFADQ